MTDVEFTTEHKEGDYCHIKIESETHETTRLRYKLEDQPATDSWKLCIEETLSHADMKSIDREQLIKDQSSAKEEQNIKNTYFIISKENDAGVKSECTAVIQNCQTSKRCISIDEEVTSGSTPDRSKRPKLTHQTVIETNTATISSDKGN